MSTTQGQLHHVELYVKDLKRSLQFWEWFLGGLGYTVYQQWEQGISYRLGQTYIVFVQTESKHLDVEYHRCRVGLNHLAFHAASRQQVNDYHALVEAHGGRLLYNDKFPYAGGVGYYALFCEDPDRIKVELVAPDESNG